MCCKIVNSCFNGFNYLSFALLLCIAFQALRHVAALHARATDTTRHDLQRATTPQHTAADQTEDRTLCTSDNLWHHSRRPLCNAPSHTLATVQLV